MTTVFCVQGKNKTWFKIASNGDRGNNAYMQASFKKKLNIVRSICYFVNFSEIKVCPKKWAYLTLKSGGLKQVAEQTWDHKMIRPYPPLEHSQGLFTCSRPPSIRMQCPINGLIFIKAEYLLLSYG